ncbi:MAG: D-alanyl-D-alanine carboxypeptidase family protein [bacterium]|nr:D-alanyl-D-alanine carboxypeptidase family protein [bacterium]
MQYFYGINKKVLVIACSVFVILLMLVVLRVADKLPLRISSTRGPNKLAQITAIEIGLLKKWQQSGSLKNTLAYTSEGSDVLLLQRMLSQDSEIYPEKKITGYYGDLTKKAVINFQKEYTLVQTGEVNTETRNKLNEIFLSHLCPAPNTIYPDFLMQKVTSANPLPLNYSPSSLLDISDMVKTVGVICLREDVVSYVTAMFKDAKYDGVEFMISSGFRNPEIQKYLYDFWIRIAGVEALDAIAKPGLSEHQLGSAVDLTDKSINFRSVDAGFENSAGGKWLKKNGYKYGFINSYPKDKKEVSGFKYEPWHWRFVGINTSKNWQQGLTYNESNFDASSFPFIKQNIDGLNLSAASFMSISVTLNGTENILIEKNKEAVRPIASITKLMTAIVASEQYKPYDIITISKNTLKDKGLTGIYHAGDSFLFPDALNALLIASHNEMANSFAEQLNRDKFISLMNKKATDLGLLDTSYVNPTGLDPEIGSDLINHSTVFDLYKLGRYLSENRPDILSITTKKEFNLYDFQKNYIGLVQKTDLLLDATDLPFKIIGGKTGETPRAKQNLLLVTGAPCGGKIYSVILGSEHSFEDMNKLLHYVNNSFDWTCRK